MSSPSLYKFRGVDHIGQSLVSDQLESNTIAWLQWGLLSVGAFTHATLSTQSPFTSRTTAALKPVVDPNETDGTVWQGLRSDWVWESGVGYINGEPIQVSGVYVNGSFVPSAATGTYAHRVEFPAGRVVFDSPIPTGTAVRVEHSYRSVQVHPANTPWFQSVQFLSLRDDDEQWTAPPGSGGAWEILSQNRIQLPAVVVEVVPRVRLTPYEIGNTAQTHRQDILFHVLAETPWDRNRLHDVLILQKDHAVPTFDKNTVTYPLDAYGAPASGAMTYPQMCQQSPWLAVRLVEASSEDQGSLGERFYWSTVRMAAMLDAP